MHPEIQKAVDAGKLSAAAGQVLDQLQPGTYVIHKSWGFGQVDSLNFLVSQMTINFKTKKGHSMQLQYAAESLQPISENHILAQKAADAAAVKARAKNDAVGLVRAILDSFGGKATQDQIAQSLAPEVFNETEFKKWWESTKKALKKDGHFAVPTKKGDPVELRDAPVSHADQYLETFKNARQLKDQLNALDQIFKNLAEFSEPATQLASAIATADDQGRKNQRLNPAQALEFLLSRDEIIEKVPALARGADAPTVAQFLLDEKRRLATLIGDLPAAKQKRALAGIPDAFGEEWTSVALSLVTSGSTRVVAESARLLEDKGQIETLITGLDRAIREHSITSEALLWLGREREGVFSELMNPRLLSAIIGALERDQFDETKRDRRLHDLLLNDKELLTDLLEAATHEELRDIMQKLMRTPVFEELNKRSLLGRIIRVYPEMQALVSGESDAKPQTLIVSWESMEKKKAEYDDLVNKKIPENVKEIQVARSYGDLRENFEFKAAKEMQRVLSRRRAETERDLAQARGTDFANPDTAQVSVGTIVTLKETGDGRTDVYTILGAWDGDPDKGIVSYQSALAQALIGHKPGEQVNVPTEHGDRTARIEKIEAYKK
ncbi:GreA/GreB family elongation factor [Chthoniobacter flavus Ellin428]|uniref:Transcription elongation factor GreA n=1 Tax=Chthoniobacter flavus Ellin428 TaxID=497964 RepID=B4D3Z7_9BACT|nr:GreA/GreB family elongation factor [Chthoniobacter flavus]EDY18977.1 GreA/GreB family elongation factor [Chthoniobacter flavus Ellin428]TCO93561.1 transcription elongation GreA/GreB family factor [Chthoniobacter flavus]